MIIYALYISRYIRMFLLIIITKLELIRNYNWYIHNICFLYRFRK